MFKSWRLGRVLGFPVEINLSFILLLAFVLVAWGGLAGVVGVLLAFGSVLLHELGHAVVARRLGVHVAGIELSFFGGAAKMTQLPRRPSHEIMIAAAGPAVSLMLGGLGLGLGILAHSPFIALIGWINFVIAGFNLIPALPMDGGRILRAALATRMGYMPATEASVIVARIFTVGFAVVGLAFGMYQLAILAPFLWMMTTAELRAARWSGAGDWDPGDGLHARVGQAFSRDPFRRHASGPVIRRRFTIVQRPDGRVVVEALD